MKESKYKWGMEGQKSIHLNKLKHSTDLRLLAPQPAFHKESIKTLKNKGET